MTETLLIFCGFALHMGIQSPKPWVRYTSNGVLYCLLFVLLSGWVGIGMFEIIRDFAL